MLTQAAFLTLPQYPSLLKFTPPFSPVTRYPVSIPSSSLKRNKNILCINSQLNPNSNSNHDQVQTQYDQFLFALESKNFSVALDSLSKLPADLARFPNKCIPPPETTLIRILDIIPQLPPPSITTSQNLSAQDIEVQDIRKKIDQAWAQLALRGILKGFATSRSKSTNVLPADKSLTIDRFEHITGLPFDAVTPAGSRSQSTTTPSQSSSSASDLKNQLPQQKTFSPILAGAVVATCIPICGILLGQLIASSSLSAESQLSGANSTNLDIIANFAISFLFLGLTLGLFDIFVLKGAILESIYRGLFPIYKEKVLKHEAGHFLIAYLFGCQLAGYTLDTWSSLKAGIPGQAGTIFIDRELLQTINSPGPVKSSSIDRYSIVAMAGIAAEAIEYGQAEGGQVDERTLVTVLSSLKPPFSTTDMMNQGRWAVAQAILIIKEQKKAYDVLVEAMREGRSISACILVIEENLDVTKFAKEQSSQRQHTQQQAPTPDDPAMAEFALSARKSAILGELAFIEERLKDLNYDLSIPDTASKPQSQNTKQSITKTQEHPQAQVHSEIQVSYPSTKNVEGKNPNLKEREDEIAKRLQEIEEKLRKLDD